MTKKNKEKELAFSVGEKDFRWETFTSGGPGGQNQNKVATGVRLIHEDSGVVVESREERSQYSNKKRCVEKLSKHPKFKLWVKMQLSKEEDIEVTVDRLMEPKNIVIEEKIDNKWSKIE